ncbi:MAG: Hsp70 family protein [Armatimonadetes bacterium]|nr:Hsp70 family protein [Armatimonadota bacterium]
MTSQTVDFGIDLGTTNSAIARADHKGVKVIKNRLHNELTASSVARTSRGQTLVGQDALDKIISIGTATKFKRLMGTANRIKMHDGSEMSPEELSAEVLKELTAAVQLRYDMPLEYVVITVPAMFQQPQCEATHKAAELAGLEAVMLLQEPIAAATAYLGESAEDGDYVVYDLGGGTFDVSVVRLRNGEMNVIGHGGDNWLGGSDFDHAIYDYILGKLKREFGCTPDGDPVFKWQFSKKCERAKVQLSSQEETVIDLGDLGLPIPQMLFDRRTLEDLIEKQVTRTIALTRERLQEAGLEPQDANALLLVGGPTMTPYIRHRLREELGIPLSLEQDPMTVVACGAAIHAASILRPDRAAVVPASKSAQSASLKLHYEAVSPHTKCTISGRILQPAEFTGEIRLASSNKDWDSGWIALREGAFVCEVSLRVGTYTEFQVSLRDAKGRLWDATPATVTIRQGVAAAKPITPYDYGVALEDGSFDVVLERDQPLPAYGLMRYRATKSIPAGSSEALPIYFLEGKSPTASDNVKVGELLIHGRDLTRTLKEGETVEVRIFQDESRRIKARVFIPLHDRDYEVEFGSMIEVVPTDDLLASINELSESLLQVEDVAAEDDASQVIQARRDFEQLEADVEHIADSEVGEADRVASKLANVKTKVRMLVNKYGPAAKHRSATQSIDRAESVCESFGDRIGLADLEDLRNEADRCLRLDDEKGLKLVEERADSLFWKHYVKTEECWTGLIAYLREERRFAIDPNAYDDALKRAEGCLDRCDFEGVRQHGFKAMSHLPDKKTEEGRFWNAGLRRA